MKRKHVRLLSLILILTILNMFCGCSNSNQVGKLNSQPCESEKQNLDNENKDKESDKEEEPYNSSPDVVHIWSYYSESSSAQNMIPCVKNYCEENNIPVQFHCYLNTEITYEDYILKRNINLSNANAIVMGDLNEMKSLSNKHADYTNVPAFSNIADSCRDLPYILLGYIDETRLLNKKLLDFYNIECDKEIITKKEYYCLINELIDKGAKFDNDNVLYQAFSRIILDKHNLVLTNTDTEERIDKTYKENLRKACKDMIDLYKNKKTVECSSGVFIKDEKTNLDFVVGCSGMCYNDRYYQDREEGKLIKSLKDTIVLCLPTYIDFAVYIGETITNQNTYDIVNYMMNSNILESHVINATRYTLKNDCENKMYNILSTESSKEDQIYFEENAEEHKRIDRILKENILNGNISKEFIDELTYESFELNRMIEGFLINIVLYCIQKPDIDVEALLDRNVDNILTKIKLRM